MAPKTPSRTSKMPGPDENRSPNEELVSPRRSRRSTNQTNGKQLTMTDMFSRKRPRESEEPVDEARVVKPKIEHETKSEEDPNSSPKQTSTCEVIDTKEEKDQEVAENGKVNQNGHTETSPTKTESTDDNCNFKIDEDVPMLEIQRCKACSQVLDDPDTKFYQGHPQNAVEEFIALTDAKLILTSGDDGDITERPVLNLTGFSVYDVDGHLCPIDGDLIESNVILYASGYLKSICCDTADLDADCVPVKDIGPINEWYIHGFDGGDQNCITLSTPYAEYNLKNPSEEYAHLMDNLYEKIGISKVTIEYLEEYHYLQPTYEDLLYIIKESPISTVNSKLMTEEMLHKHAKFICEQVVNLEVADDEDPPLVTLPCIRELIKLFGIKFGQRVSKAKIHYKKKTAVPGWTKATTTPLVRNTFEKFFSDQLDKQAEKDLVVRRKRCGVCDACQLPDCGQCNACKAMSKFGGTGKTKKACIQRNCPNMAVEQAEESEPEDDDDMETENVHKVKDDIPVKFTGAGVKNICWIGEAVKTELNKTYYESVKIDNFIVKKGDYVMVETLSPNVPYLITKITCMWKDSMNVRAGYFHAQTFTRSRDTVLGEISDPREIFLSATCCNGAPLSSIIRVAKVVKKEASADWFDLGNKDFKDETDEYDETSFFYQKIYDKVTARFEDLPFDPPCKNESRIHRYCPSCVRKNNSHLYNNPTVVDKIVDSKLSIPNRTEWTAVNWRDFNYKRGEAVFLMPETFRFKNYQVNNVEKKCKSEKVDESIYTEYYRKSESSMRGSNTDTKDPFCIGYIDAVLAKEDGPVVIPQNIYLRLNVMYRPENTCKVDPHEDDLNLLYWSDRQLEVPFSKVLGPCTLMYVDNLPTSMTVLEWSLEDFNRFYFKQAFDNQTEKITDVPEYAEGVGNPGNKKLKSKGKGKGKGSAAATIESEEVKVRPLKALDVFAGCGGLSEGLHQAGIVTSCWAIEQMSNAARAYQLNNPKCTVYTEDCNALLKSAMEGGSHSAEGLPLPARGEVELLCGGPPCQGFSGMNRFNSREYSNFKNSLVATYLSYCDYYRPKYFILENVRNFAAFKKGMVLKMTLRCLLQIGYQCSFGVLQAGNYGVPQTRRRLIILAAAPGYKLPLFPEPTHVFSRRACNLSVVIDGQRYYSTCTWDLSAPRRTCTIRDAMSDLPIITNGAFKPEIDYGTTPQSHFQRIMRMKGDSMRLRDHICKNMAPLIQARICRIPTAHGSDWRDLPNIAVILADGTRSKVLQYRHHDIKNGRGVNGSLRGVCGCSAKRHCTPEDKQDNTLIPWCLPHTGNRHNHWAGLYGRVSWDGYFSTTVTDPEPMGKQGRILHPEQDRVVSVRECARSQGFPDSYIFAGSIQDKHRQIGNAVPPPLGAALGREIKIALMNKGKP